MTENWQPRFYALCAASIALLTGFSYLVGAGGWWHGFMIGYGVASIFALMFLSVQHWSLTVGQKHKMPEHQT